MRLNQSIIQQLQICPWICFLSFKIQYLQKSPSKLQKQKNSFARIVYLQLIPVPHVKFTMLKLFPVITSFRYWQRMTPLPPLRIPHTPSPLKVEHNTVTNHSRQSNTVKSVPLDYDNNTKTSSWLWVDVAVLSHSIAVLFYLHMTGGGVVITWLGYCTHGQEFYTLQIKLGRAIGLL